MGLLTKGITKISELVIDADKVWQDGSGTPHGITSIKQVAALMSRGDLIARSDTVLVRIAAGPMSYVLTSAGLLKIPTWAPAGGALRYYFPVILTSSNTETVKAAADVIIPKNAPFAKTTASFGDSLKYASIDDPADMISRIDAGGALHPFVATDAETVVAAVDESIPKNIPVRSGLSILVDGFVEETALGVQTDHTAAARDAVANDLNLCPMSDTVLDKIYIGSNYVFWQAQVLVGTNGAGNWTNVCYYWDGLLWQPCVAEDDGSNSFEQGTGLKLISHTPQAGWALKNIMGYNLYWMMIRTDNFVNRVTKPLGSTVWVALGTR